MIYPEYVEKYGKKAADTVFKMGDHMVFVVRPGKTVTGRCGKWFGSQPLGMGQTVEEAKAALRNAVCNCFDTEETIWED
jgi:hypothetical protein